MIPNLVKISFPLTVIALLGLTTPKAQADMLVGDFGNNAVLRYDETTGAFIDVFIPPGSGGLILPDGMIFGPDNNLLIASREYDGVLRYNGTTGAFIDAFVPSGSGGLSIPIGLQFRPDNNLYVTSFGSNSVLRYNGMTGDFIDALVPPGSGGLNQPAGLVFTPTPVFEPSSGLGILALGAWGAVSLRKNKLKNQKLAS